MEKYSEWSSLDEVSWGGLPSRAGRLGGAGEDDGATTCAAVVVVADVTVTKPGADASLESMLMLLRFLTA